MADQQAGGFVRSLKDLFKSRQSASLRESVEEALEEHEGGREADLIGEGERTMLLNVLDYAGLRVDDVMVPRADIVAASIDMGLEELLGLFSEAAHSRLPLYRGDLDDVAGMVHVKDIVRSIAQDHGPDGFSLSGLRRPVLFVPPSMRIKDLLSKMRTRRTHMAIVVDEYGGTDGLVTIEDLVEEIVGEIEDEHDADDSGDATATYREEGCYDADARFEIEEFEVLAKCRFLDEDKEDDVDTLGGLVFSLAGRVPEIGEVIVHPNGFRFEVVDADPRRIAKLRIYPPVNKEGSAPRELNPNT